jgi:signal transduction histidine kinase
MNQNLQHILDFIEDEKHLSEEVKTNLIKAVKDSDRALTISEFKLERTEKVKRTTAILLEETIEELEQKRKAIEDSNEALQKSLNELKTAQSLLIQAEKMASLGELTAGIAHEIQNPLNFVNNFSEVSKELLEEMLEEIANGDMEEVNAIAQDVIQNLEKITHHGKRADGIVKGMLQHSRKNSGEKEATDINVLVDEYLRLAYHGLRSKDKSFNATLETKFDDAIGKLAIVPQDIGRVVLNLITNAFYACNEKKKLQIEGYNPIVTVKTKKTKDQIIISVADNGNGIPKAIQSKIFQPFFTTKPTGEGTGLGLSLSYDIIKAHGGELLLTTDEEKGTQFTIKLPYIN